MDAHTTRKDELLPGFLAHFPTQPHYRIPSMDELWVFWGQKEASQNNSSWDVPENPDPWGIHDKLKSVFSSEPFSFDDDFIIQFWSPVTAGGRQLLTTSNQPFALYNLPPDLAKYRLCSQKHVYNIDVNRLEVDQEHPWIISGAPARAFMNRFPEIITYESDHQENPLVRSALDSGLKACFVLPICDPSQSRCLGVVECSVMEPSILLHVIDFSREVKKVGLSVFHVRERLSYKTLPRMRDEIQDALKFICESHYLVLGQVWNAYEDENHVQFSSALEDAQTKQTLAVKLMGYSNETNNVYHSYDKLYLATVVYSDAYDVLPLKVGEGVVGKTFQNSKPHYSIVTNNDLIARHYMDFDFHCSCFAICLRSTETSDFDYVFEFIWHERLNNVALLESLLLTLKRCLPSFKFASGEELGDELCVVDVSIESESKSFKIFEGKRISQTLQALEKEKGPGIEECIAVRKGKHKTALKECTQEEIEQQFGKTMKEAALNLHVSVSTLKRKCKDHGISEWKGRNFEKRKVQDSYENQNDKNEVDNRRIEDTSAINDKKYLDEDMVIVKAEYEDDVIKFRLRVSLATFETVKKEVGKKFKLSPESYKLKYQDEDKQWILMTDDEDMTDCINSLRNVNSTPIRLRVLPSTQISTTAGPS